MLNAFPLKIAKDTLKKEIALALILKSAIKIVKKLDHRFPHCTGRLNRYWLEDEASAQHSVLVDFPDFSGVGDGPIGEHGSCYCRRCKGVDARSVPDNNNNNNGYF